MEQINKHQTTQPPQETVPPPTEPQVPAMPPHPPTPPSQGIKLVNMVEKVEQIIIFVYFFIASILMFRFVLSLFGASQKSPFVKFVYDLTSPFMTPFLGMFGRAPGVGQFRLEFEVLIALIVYALVMFGLIRLVRIIFK